jgi:hypothetical protein
MMRSILDQEETALEPQHILELQHINVKLLLNAVADLDPVIPVFHSWIQNQVFDELLLDVADYRHVKDGPGIVLIGHEADYSLDETDGRLGLRYNRKAPVAGSNQERLAQAAQAALKALNLLESDPRLNGKLAFTGNEEEILINDRGLAPNNLETMQLATPEFVEFAARLSDPKAYSVAYSHDQRRLFGATIHFNRLFSPSQLLQNLLESGPR